MPRRGSWLCLIRSIFFLETNHHKHHKRSNRRRWFFGRLRKSKGRFPTIEMPPPQPCQSSSDQPKVETEEKQSTSTEQASKESKSFESNVTYESQSLALNHHHENLDDVLAAIMIQTLYRGYLARKASRALKGFVRLQAIIRGRAVRRQAMTTLKCLQAIVNIQSEVCTRSELTQQYGHNTCFYHHHLTNDKPKEELNRRTRLDDGLLTKEDEIDIMLKKKEAILRRQRSKTYSFNHRHSTDSEDGNVQGRLKYWLEQYVKDEALKDGEKGDSKQLNLKNIESLNNHQTLSVPRRSFHNLRKQNSYIENGLVPCSPTSTVPTYMAATESTKAKTRSTSSPRLRPRNFEAYSDGDSPYKFKFVSPMSSINSDMTCLSKISSKSFCTLQQKSPSFKGIPSPVMSSRNLRDVHLDSQGLLVNKCSR